MRRFHLAAILCCFFGTISAGFGGRAEAVASLHSNTSTGHISSERCHRGSAFLHNPVYALNESPDSQAGQLALVIGNDYENESNLVPQLHNGAADAREIEASLFRLGYRTLCITNASADQILEAVLSIRLRATTTESLGRGGAGGKIVFYFAGHGGTFDQAPFIVPNDIDKRVAAATARQASPTVAISASDLFLSLADIVNLLYLPGADQTFVFLDTCRTLLPIQPFAGLIGGSGVINLTNVQMTQYSPAPFQMPTNDLETQGDAASGLAVFFSTTQGNSANDTYDLVSGTRARDGPYADALSAYLKGFDWVEPTSASAPDVSDGLRKDVENRTHNTQVPDAAFRVPHLHDASMLLWASNNPEKQAMSWVGRALVTAKASRDCQEVQAGLEIAQRKIERLPSPSPGAMAANNHLKALEQYLESVNGCSNVDVQTVASDTAERRLADLSALIATNTSNVTGPIVEPEVHIFGQTLDAGVVAQSASHLIQSTARLACDRLAYTCGKDYVAIRQDPQGEASYIRTSFVFTPSVIASEKIQILQGDVVPSASGSLAWGRLLASTNWAAVRSLQIALIPGSLEDTSDHAELLARARLAARLLLQSIKSLGARLDISSTVQVSDRSSTDTNSIIEVTLHGE